MGFRALAIKMLITNIESTISLCRTYEAFSKKSVYVGFVRNSISRRYKPPGTNKNAIQTENSTPLCLKSN